ncbi:MAG: MoaD family protein [Deltaproteobacteria bacterium]|nr:MoaD family protein [Deltaproteobacteria bacterium]
MSVTIKIPAALRAFTEKRTDIPLEARSVGEAIEKLAEIYPDLRQHLLDEEGRIRSFVSVFVGAKSIKGTGGLETALSDGDSITLVPAIAGGAGAAFSPNPLSGAPSPGALR